MGAGTLQGDGLRRLGAEQGERAGARSAELASVIADAAHRRGLLDVGYGFADSPFGPLLVAVTPKGLVRLAYPNVEPDAELALLARRLSPRVLRAPRAVDQVRRELDEYFAASRMRFDVRVDLALVGGFTRKVLAATALIPFGTLATYRDVATRAGNERAVRAAGTALGANPVPIVVPCHRVVRTGGGMGGYTGGLDRKMTLLRLEGAIR